MAWARLVVTGWLDQVLKVLVKNANNITLEDNFGIDIIFEFLKGFGQIKNLFPQFILFLKGLILFSLLPGKLSLLFPYFLLSCGHNLWPLLETQSAASLRASI